MYEHLKHRVLYLEGDMPFCVNLNVGTCMESCYGFLFMCIMSSTFFFTFDEIMQRNAMLCPIVHRRSSLDLCRLWVRCRGREVSPKSGSAKRSGSRSRERESSVKLLMKRT